MNLSFSQFKHLARQHNVIPLFDELPADLDTPVTVYAKLRTKKHGFLFESVVGGEKWARYSFIGVAPAKVFLLSGNMWRVEVPGKGVSLIPVDEQSDVLLPLRHEARGWHVYQDKNLPRFFGGFVGFMGYPMVYRFDPVPRRHPAGKNIPDLCYMLMDQVVIFDNLGQVMKIASCVFLDEKSRDNLKLLKKIYALAQKQIHATVKKIKAPAKLKHAKPRESQKTQRLHSSFNQKEFCQMVRQAKSYIEAGDIFQVVLSNRFTLSPVTGDAFAIYRRLRRINPSPYMYFLEVGDLKIVGASPEILVRLEDGRVEVRPIAGTRPRGQTEDADQEMERELLADPKELAEHIMLVDLGRNDVGRVAKTASVRVDEQKTVERYSHVMHLVSHVSADLDHTHDAWDVIRACFPAGTLSGAPKIRAMQIIDELEHVDRGVYGGAVGYVSLTGNADLAIAIRTAVITGKKAVVQAGAGIVYNSVPEKEFEECVNKARGMIAAIRGES